VVCSTVGHIEPSLLVETWTAQHGLERAVNVGFVAGDDGTKTQMLVLAAVRRFFEA
jgi:hypothetical protein